MSGISGRDNIVVVAHPDDEALWLIGALRTADVVVAALSKASPVLTDRRLAVSTEYPLPGFELLGLQSADVFWECDGRRGRPVETGVSLLESCPPAKSERYRANYAALLERLEPYLKVGSVVYTHNPWGEYGHPEHVQVSNAVVRLARRNGCSVWAWEGFSSRWQLDRGVRLRADYYPDRVIGRLPTALVETDLELYRKLRDLYIRHGAWTWDDYYEPPGTSRFVQLVDEGTALAPPGRRRLSAPLRVAARSAAGRARRAVMTRRGLGTRNR